MRGGGVYNGDRAAARSAPYGSYFGDDHPGPWRDGVSDWGADDVFGFASVSQARRWFNEPRDAAHFARKDTHLAAYHKADLGAVHRGRSQVAFDRKDAKPVHLPIHRLWDTSARDLGRLADAQRIPHDAH